MAKKFFDNMPDVDKTALKESLGVNNPVEGYTKVQLDALPIKDRFLEGLQLLGSAIKAIPMGVDLYSFLNGTMTLIDGDVQQVIFKIDKETAITGVGFISNVQGVFTEDNENAIALYSVASGVYTQVAKTANSGAIWKAAAGAKVETAFAVPVTLQPGIYVAALLYNNSAQTTAPKIYMHSTSNLRAELVLGNSMKLSGKIASQTALPTSTTGSSFVFDTNVAGLYLY